MWGFETYADRNGITAVEKLTICTLFCTLCYMTYVLPVTQARKDFLNLVDLIDEKYTRVDFTKKGIVKASLVSPDYLDELEETIYTLTHSMSDIREAEKEIKEGKYVTLDEFLKEFYASKNISSQKKRKQKRT